MGPGCRMWSPTWGTGHVRICWDRARRMLLWSGLVVRFTCSAMTRSQARCSYADLELARCGTQGFVAPRI